MDSKRRHGASLASLWSGAPAQMQMASGAEAAPPVKPAYPSCASCRRRMTVKQVSPVLFASMLDDVTFHCEDCGTEVKRTVKR